MMSPSPVITISKEAKKVSFSDVEEIIYLEEASTEMSNSIIIRDGCIIEETIESTTSSSAQDDRPFVIVDISIADGQLVAIVQDSPDEDDLQYHVPVRTIKHRVKELKDAVERLNSQGNYFKFDQDVIKFVKEVTGKTLLELKREKVIKIVADLPSDPSRKRPREEEKEENPAKRLKGDETKEIQCNDASFACKKVRKSKKKARVEKKNVGNTKFIDETMYSVKKLIGIGFASDDDMLMFRVLWSTNEKTWEPWMEFKKYKRGIKRMVRQEIRNGFEFTNEQEKAFEANTGIRLLPLYN